MKGQTLGEILGLLLGVAAKNPIIAKMAMFTVFLSVITFAFGFIKDMIAPYMINNSLTAMAGYFGVLDGISLYVTIVVAGFGVKQVLAFIRS